MEGFDGFAMGRDLLDVASLALASRRFRQLGTKLCDVGAELIEGTLTGRTDVPGLMRETLPEVFPAPSTGR